MITRNFEKKFPLPWKCVEPVTGHTTFVYSAEQPEDGSSLIVFAKDTKNLPELKEVLHYVTVSANLMPEAEELVRLTSELCELLDEHLHMMIEVVHENGVEEHINFLKKVKERCDKFLSKLEAA